jgi:hypothetical protein
VKISYTTSYGTSSYVPLGNESDRTMLVETFAPSFSQQVQTEPLFRAATPANLNRGNTSCGLSLAVSMIYTTHALALASIRSLRGVLASPLHLKVEQDSEDQHYPNAVCTSYTPVLTGRSVLHRMQFTTQDVTDTEPTTSPG